MKLGERTARVLRIAVGSLILLILYRVIGREDFAAALSRTEWRWLLPLYANAALTILLNAALLQYLLRCAGLTPGLRRVLLAKALGSFYALVLPGDVFGGAAKWADLSAATGDRAGVLSSMVLSKIALAVPPLLVGSIALAIDNPLEEPSLAVASGVVAALVISITALVLNPVTAGRVNVVSARLLRKMPGIVQRPGARLLESVADFQKLRSGNYVCVLAMSFAVFALGIAGLFFAATAVGLSIPTAVFFWVSLILFVSRLLPLTVGNLGIREGILAAAFGLYGVAPAAAVLAGLLMFSSQVVTATFGAAYQIALANGWVRWRTSTP